MYLLSGELMYDTDCNIVIKALNEDAEQNKFQLLEAITVRN